MNIQNIWKEHHKKLKAYITSQVKDEMLAEDLLHDVYIKVQKNLPSVNDSNKISSWLFRITKNVIVDYYRKHNRHQFYEYSDEVEVKAPENIHVIATQSLSNCLLPIINELPDDYREAVYLSEIEGYTQKEVASIIGLTHSGAKSRIQRGRKIMKDLLTSCCTVELDGKNRISNFDIKPSAKNHCK